MSLESTGLQNFVDRETAAWTAAHILEAGCGSRSNLRFADSVYWIGIDISQAQLDRNVGLMEKIRGDLQTYDFAPESYDAIVCWDVLEHLDAPGLALQRFFVAIKKGGIIVLKIPNVHSLKGLITKAVPHWAHKLWYQYLYGRDFTTREDGGPFKTFLRFSIAPGALRALAERENLQVAFSAYYDVSSTNWFRRKKLALWIYSAAFAVARILSLGKLGMSEYIIVMKKPAA